MDTNGNLRALLLKDLCSRLPYGVIVYDYDREETREMGLGTLHDIMFNDLECKPYLRSMLSMTEEEKKEFESLGWRVDELDDNAPWNHNSYNVFDGVDWLNKKMFDYRGLISMGLALEAKEGMYNIKEE